jgi:hypothetical protein
MIYNIYGLITYIRSENEVSSYFFFFFFFFERKFITSLNQSKEITDCSLRIRSEKEVSSYLIIVLVSIYILMPYYVCIICY